MSSHRPGPTPARLRDRPTWLVGLASVRATSLLGDGFEAHGDGLRGYHYRLLAALEEWGPASQADLGRATGIDRSDVTAALNDLEARDLVERAVDPGHRSRNIVTMTDAGRARLAVLDGVVGDVQERFVAPLSASERRQFLALLRRLLDPDPPE